MYILKRKEKTSLLGSIPSDMDGIPDDVPASPGPLLAGDDGGDKLLPYVRHPLQMLCRLLDFPVP